MAAVRKKQDDNKIVKMLREVAQLPGNKHCFDCQEKGVTYVNMTIGSFVCTSCSGILRGLTPPHRVKSISMATFTEDDIQFLRQQGNEECAKTWLGLWDAKRALKMDHRDFMVEKYERKRYYLEPASPLKSIPSTKTTNTTNGDLTSTHTGGSSCSSESANTVAAAIKSAATTSHSRLNKPPNNNTAILSSGLPDPNSIFKTCKNKTNGIGAVSSSSSTSSFASCHSGNNNNHFDADFPVDFGNADIFSATTNTNTTTNSGSHNINGHSATSSSLKLVRNHNKLINCTNKGLVNGFDDNGSNDAVTNKLMDGFSSNNGGFGLTNDSDMNGGSITVNGFENWADFEHNQIYNAAEDKNQYLNNTFGAFTTNQQHPSTYLKGLPLSSSSTTTSSSDNSTPSADKYAALKDLDEQFKEIKMTTSNGNSATNGNSDPFNTSTAGLTNGVVTSSNPFKNPFNAVLVANGTSSSVGSTTGNGTISSPWTTATTDLNGSCVNGSKVNNNGWTVVNGNGFTPQYASGYQLLNGNNGFGTGASLFDMNGFGSTSQTTNGFQSSFIKTVGGGSNPFAVGSGVNSNNPFL